MRLNTAPFRGDKCLFPSVKEEYVPFKSVMLTIDLVDEWVIGDILEMDVEGVIAEGTIDLGAKGVLIVEVRKERVICRLLLMRRFPGLMILEILSCLVVNAWDLNWYVLSCQLMEAVAIKPGSRGQKPRDVGGEVETGGPMRDDKNCLG